MIIKKQNQNKWTKKQPKWLWRSIIWDLLEILTVKNRLITNNYRCFYTKSNYWYFLINFNFIFCLTLYLFLSPIIIIHIIQKPFFNI